jgi:membrane-associated phospholipid phosphatase
MPQESSPLNISLSKVLSTVLNPLFSLLFFFGFYAYKKMEYHMALKNLGLMIFFVIIPIFGWISWNVKSGRYTNMDVSDRKQRNSLYLFNFTIIAVYIAILNLTQQAFGFILINIFLLILMMTMHFSNFFIKSSMHTAFNVFVSVLFFNLNPYFGLAWLGLTVLLGISRIILKRHTLKEVIMGASIAAVISIVYLYFDIQNQ